MIAKLFCISFTALSLTLSTPLMAKGNPHENGPGARGKNSNKQSGEYSRRGPERAEERHEQKKRKEYKKKFKEKKQKYRDDDKRRRRDYDDKKDRYRRQYEEERNGLDRREYRRYDQQSYRQNPVDTVIDRNIDDAKSRVDELRRRTIEGIDNKTREFTDIDRRNRQ